MAKDKDTQNFNGLKNFTQFLCLLLLLTDIYFFGIEFYIKYLKSEFLLDLILKLEQTGLLKSPVYPKIGVILLSACFILTDRGKKDENLDKQIVTYNAITSTLLFFSTGLIPIFFNLPILYTIIIFLTYIYLITSFTKVNKILGFNLMGDRFNVVNKIFPQSKEKVENDLSVNIPYKYVVEYNKRNDELIPVYETGFINVVAPNRASIIIGKPGSGKSYAFVEEFIKQHIQNAFSMVIYDYKFPTLTNIAYDYYENNKSAYQKYQNGSKFGVINLDDPRYSHRCNPLRPDLLKRKSEAIDAVYTIFYNIDKKSATKQDFFLMSAMAITSAALWFLRIYKGGKYCSLPHLIQFIMQPDDKMLRILDSYEELQYFTAAFSDALKKEAFEQLSGQTASARIPLGKIVTDEMFYVMTDPDQTGINLAVNKIEDVTVLNIANNPSTQKTNAPAMGLYMSQSAKLINAQKRAPCGFLVDELSTIFINGLNELIATGRSNKICTTLAFQDYSQLVMEYGKEVADSIFNTIGNVFAGQVAIDTSKKVSESMGKIDYRMQSRTISEDGDSTQISTQREYLVPPEDFNQFTQGEFAGIVSDTFNDPIPKRIFRGLVSPDKSDQTGKEFPMINPSLTTDKLRENSEQIRLDIKLLVKDELNRLAKEEEKLAEEDVEQLLDEKSSNSTVSDSDELDNNTMTAEEIERLNPHNNTEVQMGQIHQFQPEDYNEFLDDEQDDEDDNYQDLFSDENLDDEEHVDEIKNYEKSTTSLEAVKNAFASISDKKNEDSNTKNEENKIDFAALRKKAVQGSLFSDNQE